LALRKKPSDVSKAGKVGKVASWEPLDQLEVGLQNWHLQLERLQWEWGGPSELREIMELNGRMALFTSAKAWVVEPKASFASTIPCRVTNISRKPKPDAVSNEKNTHLDLHRAEHGTSPRDICSAPPLLQPYVLFTRITPFVFAPTLDSASISYSGDILGHPTLGDSLSLERTHYTWKTCC
jgi:hypothetical protein